MFNRNANAQWFGNLKNGNGTVHLGSGLLKSSYSFVSRFENGEGTNPEELIANFGLLNKFSQVTIQETLTQIKPMIDEKEADWEEIDSFKTLYTAICN